MVKKDYKELIEKINKLKKERNAVILVHNYQRPEIYEVADFIGDSLELCREAAKTDAKMIVFCGVDFMAESAKILNPEKIVLHPEKASVCPMAQMVKAADIVDLRKKHPNAAVVSYVNTTTEVKAQSDICCTSSNAVKICKSIPEEEIIFVPDENLAAYVQSMIPEKRIIPVKGWCYVHDKISAKQLAKAKKKHPGAEVLVHPECRMEVIKQADHVCSTSQMVKRVKESTAKEFIIATECDMINRLKRERADAKYYSIATICVQMKKITIEKVYDCLLDMYNYIELDKETMARAARALNRMIEKS